MRIWIMALAAWLAAAGSADAQTLYVRAGRLVDPERAAVLNDRLIKVVDGRVTSITAWSGPPPGDAPLVDWSGYSVLPGLIDMHTHLADGYGETSDPAEALKHSGAETVLKGAEVARTTLMAGFTSVRDVGAYRGLNEMALRNAIDAG